jgi:hypothetical protein
MEHQMTTFHVPHRNSLDTTDVLTDEEVDGLPLNLRCCFHIQPWSRKYEPKSVADWSWAVGWVLFRYNEVGDIITQLEAAQRAAKEVDRLWDFVLREYMVFSSLIFMEGGDKLATSSSKEVESRGNRGSENEVERYPGGC